MAAANTPDQRTESNESPLSQWIDRLDGLVGNVETWARDLGWSTRRTVKTMEDSRIGRYQAPALLIQEGTARLILEPIARSAPGAEGVVDLYMLPAYDDVASLYYQHGWKVRDSWSETARDAAVAAADPAPLTKETFTALLAELSKNVA